MHGGLICITFWLSVTSPKFRLDKKSLVGCIHEFQISFVLGVWQENQKALSWEVFDSWPPNLVWWWTLVIFSRGLSVGMLQVSVSCESASFKSVSTCKAQVCKSLNQSLLVASRVRCAQFDVKLLNFFFRYSLKLRESGSAWDVYTVGTVP